MMLLLKKRPLFSTSTRVIGCTLRVLTSILEPRLAALVTRDAQGRKDHHDRMPKCSSIFPSPEKSATHKAGIVGPVANRLSPYLRRFVCGGFPTRVGSLSRLRDRIRILWAFRQYDVCKPDRI